MLKVLRFLENIFYNIGSYLEDWADSMDTKFHDELRRALDEPSGRLLSGDELCPICNQFASRCGGDVMITIETLQAGIEHVNQAYIESPELTLDQYRALISEYLIEELIDGLLLAKGIRDENPGLNHFGFYSDPKVGYTGYVQLGDAVLFFAPTKAIVLERPEPGEDSGELSPYGVIP